MSTPTFDTGTGWGILIGYGSTIALVTWLVGRTRLRSPSKGGFLLANRDLNVFQNAFSIAGTWIWAPALFVASQQGYQNGVAGVFWFICPNVLCLIIFAPFAARIRDMMPRGYTLAGFVRRRLHSPRAQFMYLLELTILPLCSFTVQLLAGGVTVSKLTGIEFPLVTLVMAILALLPAVWNGLKASVVTDMLQMLTICVGVLVLVPWAVVVGGGSEAINAGWDGVNDVSGVFDLNVFLSFGLATTVGLLAGPFGDQSFWQRAFACRRSHVVWSFVLGAFIFAIVPTALSLLGFLAAGQGLAASDPQLVNIDVVATYLPKWTLIVMILVVISGLTSTLDSMLSAVGSLIGHDFFSFFRKDEEEEEESEDSDAEDETRDKAKNRPILAARMGMLVLGVVATLFANIPGLSILHMFLIYGALRATVFLPTVSMLISPKIHEPGVFWGILLALVVGWPLFIYGQITKQWPFHVAGTISEIVISGGLTVVVSWWMNARGVRPPKLASRWAARGESMASIAVGEEAVGRHTARVGVEETETEAEVIDVSE